MMFATSLTIWLFWARIWLGAAALLYVIYIGCVAISWGISKGGKEFGDRASFQLMREFFFLLPRNIAGCFKGRKIVWHLIAIGLGIALVVSGFDWFFFCSTRSPQLLAWIEPATFIGVELPLFLPPLFLLAGIIFKRMAVTRIGWALGQAALISLVLAELFKAVTGRRHPPYHLEFVRSSPRHVFHFGLQPGWDYSPYQVTEADTSHVFHFGVLRGGIVYGWPSAHTAVAFAMSATLFVLFRQKKWLGAAALLYAFYIGIGVSMTIHWFSDFASGAIFGTIVGITVGRRFAAMELKDQLGPNTALELTPTAP